MKFTVSSTNNKIWNELKKRKIEKCDVLFDEEQVYCIYFVYENGTKTPNWYNEDEELNLKSSLENELEDEACSLLRSLIDSFGDSFTGVWLENSVGSLTWVTKTKETFFDLEEKEDEDLEEDEEHLVLHSDEKILEGDDAECEDFYVDED